MPKQNTFRGNSTPEANAANGDFTDNAAARVQTSRGMPKMQPSTSSRRKTIKPGNPPSSNPNGNWIEANWKAFEKQAGCIYLKDYQSFRSKTAISGYRSPIGISIMLTCTQVHLFGKIQQESPGSSEMLEVWHNQHPREVERGDFPKV